MDGTQRMESPKNDPKNVKKISVFIKKIEWKHTFFSEKTLFKTIQWLERFIFVALTF